MRNALILHGMPSWEEYSDSGLPAPPDRHWLPWLRLELSLAGVDAQAPELPEPYRPVYEAWRKTFESFEIGSETLLAGHSCGGGFIVRWLSEGSRRVGRVALVAPWLDPFGELDTGFFDFELDPRLIERTDGVVVFYSRDDREGVLESVERLRGSLPALDLRELNGYGHFVEDSMGTDAFPELRDALLSPSPGR